jgi:hypothetical protein
MGREVRQRLAAVVLLVAGGMILHGLGRVSLLEIWAGGFLLELAILLQYV